MSENASCRSYSALNSSAACFLKLPLFAAQGLYAACLVPNAPKTNWKHDGRHRRARVKSWSIFVASNVSSLPKSEISWCRKLVITSFRVLISQETKKNCLLWLVQCKYATFYHTHWDLRWRGFSLGCGMFNTLFDLFICVCLKSKAARTHTAVSF